MGLGRVVAGSAAGLGLVGLGYAGLAGQDDTTRDETGAVVEGGEVGALRIRVGDCFGDFSEGSIEAVDAVPCSDPHVNEVYAAFNVPGDSSAAFPGTTAIESSAEEGCFDRFEPFVGIEYELSVFGFGAIYPTAATWAEVDDREVLCLIGNFDGSPKTGSAESSGR